MNVNELAKALEALSPADALELIDSIARVQERAAKEREEKAAAERERDERYPMCTCGKPATEYGYFIWYLGDCEPGIGRPRGYDTLRGGMILGDSENCGYPPKQEDTARIERMMWVRCGSSECEWKAIENGFDLKVGERW
jgi:hypothetical protein